MEEPDEVRTVAQVQQAEIPRIRGSRFVADLAPAADEPTALRFVDEVRGRWPDATHHCWAFRLAAGRERSDDDGEPGGTAGLPMLRHLHGAGLTDVVVVVTRWFGGTRLGRGGLVRAYGAATAAVIEAAPIVVRPVVVRLVVVHDYALSGVVEGVCAGHDVQVVGADYGADVSLQVDVPRDASAAFVTSLSEATAGRVRARPAGPAGRPPS